MENHLGGNSSNGQNKFSKFPLGAHYLPLPNKENTEIIEFLKECKIYQGDDENGDPILDEYQMTFPQQERLFFKIHGKMISFRKTEFLQKQKRNSTVF
jgi:hypothetical protein